MTAFTTRPCLAVLAAATLLTGCSSARYASYGGAGGDRPIEVEVTNNNWMDMTVYAMRGSARFRLGTVTTGETRRFDLPRVMNVNAGEMRLMADPVGSQREYQSQPVIVEPGTRVRWSLENHLALSSFSVMSMR